MLFRPKCSCCDREAATIEVIAPHELPAEWSSWEEARQELFAKYRDPEQHYLIYMGPECGTGGIAIAPERAERIITACTSSDPAAIRGAGFYDDAGFCAECGVYYCATHWSISSTGRGSCPNNHGKSLDPHWSPDD